MIIPLGDTPNPRGLHWMTVSLIVANVAVYLFVTVPLSASPANPADPRVAEFIAAIARQLPPGAGLRDVVGSLSQYDLVVFERGFRPAKRSTGCAAERFRTCRLRGDVYWPSIAAPMWAIAL